jgi:hypothetical protein
MTDTITLPVAERDDELRHERIGQLVADGYQARPDTTVIEVGPTRLWASWIRSPACQRITISPRSRRPCAPSPAARVTATISSTFGGSAG